ncbi:fungal versatile peroxidase from pleurotus Eryngii [Pluteus cervinus]|uniref:Fungal versatile peroxidase from pleurotus Eryngii n=1 Tax=Pluteus cervinus TaxID=181527 RepID=A0ACD3AHZ6_9AGAR|nr:fungal versatile peroxidase from pleurotus Eryngii [Pluteus cervinus]
MYKGRQAPKSCCVWYEVLDDLQTNLFEGGQCVEEAHEALRLTFHDAIGYSYTLGGGGADGSIMQHFDVEGKFPQNDGIDSIVEIERPYALRHKVSFADMIQFAGAVGVSNCRGAPRLEFLAGRSNSSYPSPDGLLPDPSDSADKILARMLDAGFLPNELVALLASHSVAAQDTIDPTIHGSPFDTTPSEFDARFFAEMRLKGESFPGNGSHPGELQSPLPGEFRLQSDWAISGHSATACEWQSYITNHDQMMDKFRSAMSKMALLGQKRQSLTDCSMVIPTPAVALAQVVTLPAGKSNADIEPACLDQPFPTLSSDPGPQTSVPPVPSNDGDDDDAQGATNPEDPDSESGSRRK